MAIWDSLYEETATNAEIAAAASETFFSTNAAKQQIAKNQQSFNALEINNDDASTDIDVDLDGLAARRRRVFSKSSMVISPEDGIFFNNVKVTNVHASSATGSTKLKLNARMLRARRGS